MTIPQNPKIISRLRLNVPLPEEADPYNISNVAAVFTALPAPDGVLIAPADLRYSRASSFRK